MNTGVQYTSGVNNESSAHIIEEMKTLERLRKIKSESERALHFGTFEYDFEKDIAEWSSGVYELFGYNDERPVINYDRFVSHFHPDNKEESVHILNESINDSKEYCVQYDILTHDHKQKRIEVIGKKEFDEQGRPVRNVGIIQDITNQYAQQQTINKVISELQRSNKELEEFAYVASHDMQEPLRKITTFADMLKAKLIDKLEPDSMLYMERIVTAADNMRILIDNLLEFSRISTSKQTFVRSNMDFLFKEVRTDLDLIIEETGTVINKQPLPLLEVIPAQIKQLFNNILSNAIKFRRHDVQPVIDITTSPLTLKEKATLQLPNNIKFHKIEICDNGIGFDNQYAQRIFQIFQRLHGKSEYPGSGIGLAICKKIVEQHNGVINAANMDGKGACFTIILPEKQP